LKGRGGEPDLEKAALILLQDYRDGSLGRVSLETPQSRAGMLAAEAQADAGTAEEAAR
jgi:ribosome biogenesis GTPase A